MEESKLGKLLKRFGVVVAVGLKCNPDCLIGQPCEFITMQETTERGVYAKIIPDSVKNLSGTAVPDLTQQQVDEQKVE